jgi:hypothetical protein
MRRAYPRYPNSVSPNSKYFSRGIDCRFKVRSGEVMSPREERAIRNEELFREVNLNIARMEEEARRTDLGDELPLI